VLTQRLQILRPERGWNPGPEWLGPALDEFRANLGHPEYPCNFGRHALEHRELFVTWVDGDEPVTLLDDLAAFVDNAQLDEHKRKPLAVFFRPPARPRTSEQYDEQFWALLQYLHDHDDRPWPDDVPHDPHDDGWMFAFHGVPLFVFALNPANRLRHSRNLCRCLVVVFQPRTVFAGIEVGTPAGDATRRGIRRRLAKWDPIPAHPSFGALDSLSLDEWRQYFLTDDNSDLHGKCPWHYNPSRPAPG
jgi:FPC/CPF motif-containing protein YcgG